jgi:hypothetical protein
MFKVHITSPSGSAIPPPPAFDRTRVVPTLFERVGDAPDGLETDLFLVGHPEEIDDVSAVPIINNGNFHGYSAPV